MHNRTKNIYMYRIKRDHSPLAIGYWLFKAHGPPHTKPGSSSDIKVHGPHTKFSINQTTIFHKPNDSIKERTARNICGK